MDERKGGLVGLMDTARQALKGRSEMIEKGIDGAVERLSRYSERFGEQAEGWKARVRELDEDRDPSAGGNASATEAAGEGGGTPSIVPEVEPTDLVDGPDEGGPYPAV